MSEIDMSEIDMSEIDMSEMKRKREEREKVADYTNVKGYLMKEEEGR